MFPLMKCKDVNRPGFGNETYGYILNRYKKLFEWTPCKENNNDFVTERLVVCKTVKLETRKNNCIIYSKSLTHSIF